MKPRNLSRHFLVKEVIMRGIRELLLGLALIAGVGAAGVTLARDLGQALQVIRTCEGRGEAAHCTARR
jgi:hypothetical protein